jgi:hypothetical protein
MGIPLFGLEFEAKWVASNFLKKVLAAYPDFYIVSLVPPIEEGQSGQQKVQIVC